MTDPIGGVKGEASRVDGYVKAHWKELLALVLAAIPALFLIFHKGTQKAAAQAIDYIPATFGGGGDSVPAAGATAAAAIPAVVAAAASAFDPRGRAAGQSPPNPPTARGVNPSPALRGGGDPHGPPVGLTGTVTPVPTAITWSVDGYNGTRVAAPGLSSAYGVTPSRDVLSSLKRAVAP